MVYFDNDYMGGALPEVMDALQKTNGLKTVGYGRDTHSANAKRMIREECGLDDADVWMLVGGTQTNATVIEALLRPFQGVLAVTSAHINVHEAGAIEAAGHKILTLPEHEGKMDAEELHSYLAEIYSDDSRMHMVVPGLVYITFPTEYGTIYSLAELERIREVCNEFKLWLYLDGARLGYGLAAEGCDVTLKDIARICDVFYIGGTKEGLIFGEAIVAHKGVFENFFTVAKRHGAIVAKGRMLGVQFETLFSDGLYMRVSHHAVRLAMRIRDAFISKGYKPTVNSPTNQQFFTLPNEVIDRLQQTASFEYWGPRGNTSSTIRIVTSWATTDEDVETLIGNR